MLRCWLLTAKGPAASRGFATVAVEHGQDAVKEAMRPHWSHRQGAAVSEGATAWGGVRFGPGGQLLDTSGSVRQTETAELHWRPIRVARSWATLPKE